MEILGVSRNTISQAMKYLKDNLYVEIIQPLNDTRKRVMLPIFENKTYQKT